MEPRCRNRRVLACEISKSQAWLALLQVEAKDVCCWQFWAWSFGNAIIMVFKAWGIGEGGLFWCVETEGWGPDFGTSVWPGIEDCGCWMFP